MALVSMKTDDSPTECMPNPYGYGLCIRLNDDQCEALGITKPLAAGSRVQITAIAIVTEATESVEMDGDDTGIDIQLSLQITDMELATGARSTGDIAKTMYPDMT